MAKTSLRVKAVAPAQVQDPRLHALPPLRPPARRLPQVRHLPDLPARARAQRLHPRHDEDQLVDRDVDDRSHRRLPDAHPQRHHAPQHDDRRDPGLAAQARDGPHPPGAGLHLRLRGRATAAERPGDRSCACSSSTRGPLEPRSPASSASRAPASAYYVARRRIPKVHGGMGTTIMSTSQRRHDRPRGPRSGRRRRGRGGGLVAAMSRIGRKPIPVPAGVDDRRSSRSSSRVKGPKGELTERISRDIDRRAGRRRR